MIVRKSSIDQIDSTPKKTTIVGNPRKLIIKKLPENLEKHINKEDQVNAQENLKKSLKLNLNGIHSKQDLDNTSNEPIEKKPTINVFDERFSGIHLPLLRSPTGSPNIKNGFGVKSFTGPLKAFQISAISSNASQGDVESNNESPPVMRGHNFSGHN